MECGCFLFRYTALYYQRKLNFLQYSYLHSIIGAIKFTPIHSLNIEICCPPLYIRFRLLIEKFLSISFSSIIDNFISVNNNWWFIHRFLSLLSSLKSNVILLYKIMCPKFSRSLFMISHMVLLLVYLQLLLIPIFLALYPLNFTQCLPVLQIILFNQYINTSIFFKPFCFHWWFHLIFYCRISIFFLYSSNIVFW